ncbi:MAG: PEGA domain-containing protein [Kiritimatiellae bacterium]|nr:PEGA domain-containing protein [Kiritimatiellia bacterium]
MRRLTIGVCLLSLASGVLAGNLRVAVLDFEDTTSAKSDALLGGKVESGVFAEKAVLLLAQELLNEDGVDIIDRRDFIAQINRVNPKVPGVEEARTSFIHAAQLLRADAVLRGNLLSLSVGKERVNPDANAQAVEFSKVSLRVLVQALDVVDGTVLASAQGVTSRQFRQSTVQQTTLGEDELFVLLEEALKEATPKLKAALAERVKARGERPRVLVTVRSTDDPALVEIDGVLVGTTPMEGVAVYTGDHVLSVGRPGYAPIRKRLVLEKNVEISVPMLRLDLSAEEKKELMGKAEMRVYVTDGKPDMVIQTID